MFEKPEKNEGIRGFERALLEKTNRSVNGHFMGIVLSSLDFATAFTPSGRFVVLCCK